MIFRSVLPRGYCSSIDIWKWWNFSPLIFSFSRETGLETNSTHRQISNIEVSGLLNETSTSSKFRSILMQDNWSFFCERRYQITFWEIDYWSAYIKSLQGMYRECSISLYCLSSQSLVFALFCQLKNLTLKYPYLVISAKGVSLDLALTETQNYIYFSA